MISLNGRTASQEICNSLCLFVTNAPINRLASINTDAAKSMTSKVNGFPALCREHNDFPLFLSYHCICHQEVLA
jgi:hypothetical protein